MSKATSLYRCEICGTTGARWSGRCPACGEWDSFREEAAPASRRVTALAGPSREAVPLASVSLQREPHIASGLSEFDRALGGGLVPGGVTLLGGDPGIGKSTLLLQVAGNLSAAERTVLYATGEETPSQIRLRAERLGVHQGHVLLLSTSDLQSVTADMKERRPALVVLDSIQTFQVAGASGLPGSLTQVRECAQALVVAAKELDIAVFLIGHVTKDGSLAGPRVLEHLVDTVLSFEGDRHRSHRILRVIKNRFGPTDEVGIFEMGSRGLQGVSDPSRLFVGEGVQEPGSTVFPALEGTRSILVEIQALAAPGPQGTPARRVSGVNPNRVALALAVLEQRARIPFSDRDVFVNAVGGVRIDEPACDLAIVLALATSRIGVALPPGTVVLGEVGLAGEVRRVERAELRLREAARLGYRRAILPRGDGEDASGTAHGIEGRLQIHGVGKIGEALAILERHARARGAAAPPR